MMAENRWLYRAAGLLLPCSELKLHAARLMIIKRMGKRIRPPGEITLKLPGSAQL
jgi:hypothetical protein